MRFGEQRHHDRSEARRCHIASDAKYQTFSGPELFAQAGIQIRIKWKFIQVLDVLQRVERQLLKRSGGFANAFISGVAFSIPVQGIPCFSCLIRILLFPQLMPQSHPVERDS